jgi:hypothetical protein
MVGGQPQQQRVVTTAGGLQSRHVDRRPMVV